MATNANTNRRAALKQRFRVLPHTNTSGTTSWRVTGICRDGIRIRENHQHQAAATRRQLELEAEFHGNSALLDPSIKFTRLDEDALRICEAAVVRLNNPADLTSAVDFWLAHGRNRTVKESPKLDDAVAEFICDIKADKTLRPATVQNWRCRAQVFRSEMPNATVATIMPDDIKGFLARRKAGGRGDSTVKGDKKAISAFFNWALDKGYVASNPTTGLARRRKGAAGNGHTPAILTVEECKRLLEAAVAVRDGAAVPFVVLGLFGCLRPSEATRIKWEDIRLATKEVTIRSSVAKTGKVRHLEPVDTLFRWLEAYHGKPIVPPAFSKTWKAVRERAGLLDGWVQDVLRHTGISHFWRKTESYGLTAQHAGNSERTIRQHYQARVSPEECATFFNTLPMKGGDHAAS